jgi:hypothetical protein
MPPKAKSTIARTWAASDGSPQGSLVNHRSKPRPARPSAAFERGEDVEEGQQAGEEHRERQEGVQQLPALMDAGVGILMVDAHGDGEGQKEEEQHPRHGVAEQPPTRLGGDHGVPRDVGRKQPEIHDGMPREPEERARQERVGAREPVERPGDEQKQHLSSDAQGGDGPHGKGDQ